MRLWKKILAGLVALGVLGIAAIVLLPWLAPESAVRRQVESALSEQLGRPVRIESVSFTWADGLEAGGIEIDQAAGEAGRPFARVRRLSARFNPVEVLRNAAAGQVPVDALRLEGLELWLVHYGGGRWNIDDLLAKEAAKIRAVQVTEGVVHLENRPLGRTLTLADVHATLGELESTGQAYVNLAAGLPASGRVLVTASLESRQASPSAAPAPPSGSLKVEWTGAAWPDLASALTDDARLTSAVSRTNGRMAVAFARGSWSAEGAVEAADLVLAHAADGSTIALPEAVLGFQVRQTAADRPLEVNLAKFSAPGIDLKAFGTVRLGEAPDASTTQDAMFSRAPQAPASGATSADAVARNATSRDGAVFSREPQASASTGGASATPAPADPRLTPGASHGPAGPELAARGVDLQITGNIVWDPLCRKIDCLKVLADRFQHLGGGTAVTLALAGTPDGYRVSGSADLLRTQAVWPGAFRKDVGQPLRLEIEASAPRDLRAVDVARLDVVTDAGRVTLAGRAPLAAPDGPPGRRLAGARLDVRADLKQAQRLLAMVPALAEAMGPVRVSGPAALHLSCEPSPPSGAAAGADEQPSWTAKLQADLTAAHLWVVDGPVKPPQTRATLEATALVTPDAPRAVLRNLRTALAATVLEWNGTAQVEWPKAGPGTAGPDRAGCPVGHFEGTLKATDVESAGALLAPDRFPSAAPLLAGEAAVDVVADLAENRLRGRMQAGLDRLAVRAAEYFVKPAGQPASVALTGFWQAGADHSVQAEADVALPGGHVRALGRGTLLVKRPEPPAEADAPADAPPPQGPRVSVAPDSTLELQADLADLEQAVQLVPALAPHLKGRRLEGRAETTLVLSLKPRAFHVVSTVDLTESALDFGQTLRKPRSMPLKIDLAFDALPPRGETLELYLAKAEARLGDSVAGASGRVRIAWPVPPDALAGGAQVLALSQEADLKVYADWQHDAATRQALPWLQDVLYARADLDGRTRLTASLAGTPIKGTVTLDLDATGCRILHGNVLLKPAGTAAAVHLAARYGDVPGELAAEKLAMKLADAEVTAQGRLLFRDPHLLTLAAPTAWTFRIEGRAPDAAALASLFPARLEDLKPTGGVSFTVQASGDAAGAELQALHLAFERAAIVWLGQPVLLNGALSYDGNRLATDGLDLVVGPSDLRLVAYILQPDRTPTGSVVLKGRRLALKETQDLIQQTSEKVAGWAAEVEAAGAAAKPNAPARPAGAPQPLSEQLALWGRGLLARAQLSAELQFQHVSLAIPQWNTTYELADLRAEGRLAGQRFAVPHFACALNGGTISGELALDFKSPVPVLTVAYDARDLEMAENLKPFIDTTFPGMQVFGTLSTRAALTQRLAGKASAEGRGETVLTDGLLEGPAAPDYITSLLPGLKLTQYRFHRMSNAFENKDNGDVDNRMIFEGKSYNIYIFGVTHADGRIDYVLGVDLSGGLGPTLSRALDQGKLPLMYFTGRIVGAQFAEREVRYVLPHEFAYDVFVRRSLLVKVIKSLGEQPPEIPRPLVVPSAKDRPPPAGPARPPEPPPADRMPQGAVP